MTDQEMEEKFDEAFAKWREAHPSAVANRDDARYFFWRGAEMGLKACADLYKDTITRY